MSNARTIAVALAALMLGAGWSHAFTVSFRQGTNGYSGTRDTWIRADRPTTNLSTDRVIFVDNQSPVSQGLLQFANIQGTGPGQLPPGCPIIEMATLRLYVGNPGDPVQLYRVLGPWSDTNTWESLSDGLSAEAGEIAAVPDATVITTQLGYVDIDVTASVQAWIEDHQANYGWALITSGANGSSFDSSESTNAVRRPLLMINFSVTFAFNFCPLKIFSGPTNQQVLECNYATLRAEEQGVLARQWFKDGVAVPDATNNPQALLMRIQDAGLYWLTVTDGFRTLTSSPALLTVIPSNPPVRMDCVYATNATSILIGFSTVVEGADQPNHYEVRKANGGPPLPVLSAQYTWCGSTASSCVLLTLGAEMDPVGNYTIRASGMYDFCPGNPIENSTVPVTPGGLRINVRRTNDLLILDWPCIGQLERNNNLNDPRGWSWIFGATNPYTRPITGSRNFFRVRLP
jgi:hypothetical protein